jgi:CheY-like chemotaxis protein
MAHFAAPGLYLMTLVSILPLSPAANPRRTRRRLTKVELRVATPAQEQTRRAPRRAARRETKADKTIHSIVAAVPEAAVIHASDDGTILDANPRFEALAGLRRKQLLRRPLKGLALWADRAELAVTAVRIEFSGRDCVLLFVRDVPPSEAATEKPPAPPAPIEAPQPIEPSGHAGVTKPFVLVVDADPETRFGMIETLQGQYQVVTAASEPEAQALLDQHRGRIAIILMDAALGGIDDGLRFVKRLRSEPAWRYVPIMATIPRALPEYDKTALAAGCNGYLVKLSRLEPGSPESPATGPEERPFRPRPAGSQFRIDWRAVCRRVIRQALR